MKAHLIFVVILGVGCTHEAKRENPLDPDLTATPQLQVALDDTAGTATLTWTAYDGKAPLSAYWVLRNAVESSRVETLATVADAGTTVFLDTTVAPQTAYEYRVSTVNTAGLEVPSRGQSIGGYSIGAVRLVALEPDSTGGTITLRWSQYRDPGFSSYTVIRRQVGTDQEQALATLGARADTAFADISALHDVSYLYWVTMQALPG